eukprot:1866-Heterococcus_DN1.PRE.2
MQSLRSPLLEGEYIWCFAQCNPVAAQCLCYAYFKHASCAKRKQAATKHRLKVRVHAFAAASKGTQLGYKARPRLVSKRRLLSCEQKFAAARQRSHQQSNQPAARLEQLYPSKR